VFENAALKGTVITIIITNDYSVQTAKALHRHYTTHILRQVKKKKREKKYFKTGF